MIKYILPAIIIFLVILFWEKIVKFFEKKFNIKLNYIIVILLAVSITIIITLLNL